MASGGFKVPATLAANARAPGYEFLVQDPTFKAVFAPNGTLLGEGGMMYRPTYAQTLDTIVKYREIRTDTRQHTVLTHFTMDLLHAVQFVPFKRQEE